MYLKHAARIALKCFSVRKYSNQVPKSVGFIGLGFMGSYLAVKMVQKNTKVFAYDKNKRVRENMEKLGVVIAKPKEIAAQNDIIFLLLPSYDEIVKVCAGHNGISAGAKKGLLIVDLSTIGPVNTIRLEQGLREMEIDLLSAPASGGPHSNSLEEIVFLVGGNETYLKRVEPYMKQMGQEKVKCIFHVGPDICSGQSARVCNVLLLACTMVATAEVMNLGIRLGLEPKKLVEALNSSSANCWSCKYYNPVPGILDNPAAPPNNDYNDGQSVKVFLNSLMVSQEVAIGMHAPIPLGSLASQIYSIMSNRGYNNKDFSIVYKLFKQTLMVET